MKYFYKRNKEKGLVKWIIIIVISLVLASHFFDFSIKKAIENETTQENIEYVSVNAKNIWKEYLSKPANYLWRDIFLNLLWESFIVNLERIKKGEDTIFEMSAPGIDISNTKDDDIEQTTDVETEEKEEEEEKSSTQTTLSITNPPLTVGFTNNIE